MTWPSSTSQHPDMVSIETMDDDRLAAELRRCRDRYQTSFVRTRVRSITTEILRRQKANRGGENL